jgi:hypothetical protein
MIPVRKPQPTLTAWLATEVAPEASVTLIVSL